MYMSQDIKNQLTIDAKIKKKNKFEYLNFANENALTYNDNNHHIHISKVNNFDSIEYFIPN